MRIRIWATGLFIVLGFALFTGILFLVGSRENLFSRHIDVYTEFSNINGLPTGAKVLVDGLAAGHVKRIQIPGSPSGKFRVQLQIEDRVRRMVRNDSIAAIQTEGVVGDKFVSITKGSDQAPEAGPGTTLSGKETSDISALLEKGTGLLNELGDS